MTFQQLQSSNNDVSKTMFHYDVSTIKLTNDVSTTSMFQQWRI